jgi:hypothetical protein
MTTLLSEHLIMAGSVKNVVRSCILDGETYPPRPWINIVKQRE